MPQAGTCWLKILNVVLDKNGRGEYLKLFLRALGERTGPDVGVVGAFLDLAFKSFHCRCLELAAVNLSSKHLQEGHRSSFQVGKKRHLLSHVFLLYDDRWRSEVEQQA